MQLLFTIAHVGPQIYKNLLDSPNKKGLEMAAVRTMAGIPLFFTLSVGAGLLLQGTGGAAALCAVLPVTLLLSAVYGRQAGERIGRLLPLLMIVQLGIWVSVNEGIREEADPGPSAVERLSEGFREGFGRRVEAIPFSDPQTPGLIRALVAGDRSGLSRETRRVFRESGASHLLALSGLHLGILYAILQLLTGIPGRGRRWGRIFRFLVLTGGSGAYCLLTGASPSLVRAFLFILLAETARLTGRKASLTSCLCGALVLQLAFHPGALRSVGFQLSYLAVAGIALLYPPLRRLYPPGPPSPMRYIWNGASLSIACQAFTAPLVAWRFHQFPRYFLLTNLLALPLTTLLMVSTLLTLGLFAAGCCPDILIKATDTLVHSLVWVLTVISGM